MTDIATLPAENAGPGVYISDALARRAATRGDPADELRALQTIAAAMADRPADVLPLLVEQAMKLTGGSSAGLSLYEPDPAPGVFRWRNLQGLLARFEGATTPRNHSPCGVTLDRNCATLAAHPEIFYDWIAGHDLVIPEVLLVPLYIGGEEPLGTLWIVADQEGHFDQGHADTAGELARFAGQALKMIREERRLRRALGEQETLASEMSHRLKNLFAMTDGMIRGSARNAESVDDFAAALSGRLHALAKAHSLVQSRASRMASGKVSDFAELVGAVLKVHELAGDGSVRVVAEGPPVPCGAHATNSLALMIHELATNSAKFGALSAPGGHLDVTWRLDGEDVAVDWTETGGPPIHAPPARSGFGTTLVARTVEGQFAGSFTQDWRREGLAAKIRMKASTLDR